MNTPNDTIQKNAGTPVVQLKDLSKAFHKNNVLQGFSLDVFKGECVAVMGKSGSGKSVLIKCIIGLLTPDKGSICVLGQNVLELSHDELDKMRARVGFLFQSNALYDSMSVRGNLEFPLRYHASGLSEKERSDRVLEALTNVGLAHTIDMMPSELSGGMKKRIALARTLILRPEILLYDEPTAGLDPVTGSEISRLIRSLAKKYNTSSILISHDTLCVQIAADRVAILTDGICYAQGSYEELCRSGDPRVQQFFITDEHAGQK